MHWAPSPLDIYPGCRPKSPPCDLLHADLSFPGQMHRIDTDLRLSELEAGPLGTWLLLPAQSSEGIMHDFILKSQLFKVHNIESSCTKTAHSLHTSIVMCSSAPPPPVSDVSSLQLNSLVAKETRRYFRRESPSRNAAFLVQIAFGGMLLGRNLVTKSIS